MNSVAASSADGAGSGWPAEATRAAAEDTADFNGWLNLGIVSEVAQILTSGFVTLSSLQVLLVYYIATNVAYNSLSVGSFFLDNGEYILEVRTCRRRTQSCPALIGVGVQLVRHAPRLIGDMALLCFVYGGFTFGYQVRVCSSRNESDQPTVCLLYAAGGGARPAVWLDGSGGTNHCRVGIVLR